MSIPSGPFFFLTVLPSFLDFFCALESTRWTLFLGGPPPPPPVFPLVGPRTFLSSPFFYPSLFTQTHCTEGSPFPVLSCRAFPLSFSLRLFFPRLPSVLPPPFLFLPYLPPIFPSGKLLNPLTWSFRLVSPFWPFNCSCVSFWRHSLLYNMFSPQRKSVLFFEARNSLQV